MNTKIFVDPQRAETAHPVRRHPGFLFPQRAAHHITPKRSPAGKFRSLFNQPTNQASDSDKVKLLFRRIWIELENRFTDSR